MYQYVEGLALEVQSMSNIFASRLRSNRSPIHTAKEFRFNDQLYSEHNALVSALVAFESILPPLDDPWGIEPFESLSLINPHLIIAHTTYHGSRLILHSLRAKEDLSSRLKVLAAAESLVALCSQLRGARGLRRVHAPLILLVSDLPYLRAPATSRYRSLKAL